MAVRNVAAGKDVKDAIVKETPNAKVDVMELDLTSMASVRKFASEYNSLGLPLNILLNNAGVMATPFELSKDNIELQFATNHVGHFLLADLLLETMKDTARESNIEGRIINVSSDAHKFTYKESIRFDKINDESSYNTLRAYGQSKLSNILHANELARRLKVLMAHVVLVTYMLKRILEVNKNALVQEGDNALVVLVTRGQFTCCQPCHLFLH